MLINKGEKVAIWGTGSYAKKVYLLERKNYDIVCFYDNDETKWEGELYGHPIKQFDPNNKTKIIIASECWEEISKNLCNHNLRLLREIIPYQFIHCEDVSYHLLRNMLKICHTGGVVDLINRMKDHRKVAVIYGNCQTDILRPLLLMNRFFAQKYFFVQIPVVYAYDSDKILFDMILDDTDFWECIDLFLCQKIHQGNRFSRKLETEYLVNMLSPSCQIVRIVNMWFSGYFVQTYHQTVYLSDKSTRRAFIWPDFFVNEMLDRGFSEEIILKWVMDDDFIPSEIVRRNIDECLIEFKRREKEADVIISDYIESKYDKEQLFYSPLHPTNKVLIEYSRRILEYLGLQDNYIDESAVYHKAGSLKGIDVPVYPSVLKTLDLKEYEHLYVAGPDKEFLFYFEEYIKKYIVSIVNERESILDDMA